MTNSPASGPAGAPASTPTSQPVIRGLNWNMEIGKVDSHDPQERKRLAERRKEFYRLRAIHEMGKLKDLQPPNLKAALEDPGRYGFLEHDKIAQYSKTFDVPQDAKTAQLSVYLKEFFKQAIKSEDNSISDADAELRANREVYLTLHYFHLRGVKDRLGKRINVDLLHPGETVTIANGKLSVTTRSASDALQYRIDEIPLRPTMLSSSDRRPPPPEKPASAPPAPPASAHETLSGPDRTPPPPAAPARRRGPRRKLPSAVPAAGTLSGPARKPPEPAPPSPKDKPPPPSYEINPHDDILQSLPSTAEYTPRLSTQLEITTTMIRTLSQKEPGAFEDGRHSINYRMRGIVIPQLKKMLQTYEDSQDPSKKTLVIAMLDNISTLEQDVDQLIRDVEHLQNRIQKAIAQMEKIETEAGDAARGQEREKTLARLKEGFGFIGQTRGELARLTSFLDDLRDSLHPVSGRTELPASAREIPHYIEVLTLITDALDKFSEE